MVQRKLPLGDSSLSGSWNSPLRQEWPDVFRGIAIVAVVTIHCSGHVLSRMSTCGWSWYAMASVNRSLQFAVPAFLLVSAYLNASSLIRAPQASAIALMSRRLRSIGLPYVMASAVGLWVCAHATRSTVTIRHVVTALLLGRGYFHLYFVVLIAQLYVILPLVLRLFRRRQRLSMVLIYASCLQMLIFAVNRWTMAAPSLHYIRESWPTITLESSLLWYIPSVAIGVWLAAHTRCGAGAAVPIGTPIVAAAALVIYLPLSVLSMVQPTDTLTCQTSEWAYTTSASLALVAFSVRIARCTWLAAIGRRSLTIYLAHPFVIDAVDAVLPGIRHIPAWVAAPMYVGMAMSVCLLLSNSGSLAHRIMGGIGQLRTLRSAVSGFPDAPDSPSAHEGQIDPRPTTI